MTQEEESKHLYQGGDTILYSPSEDSCYIEGVSSDVPPDATVVQEDDYYNYWLKERPEGVTRAWDYTKGRFYWKKGDPDPNLTIEQKRDQLKVRLSLELSKDIHAGDRVYSGDLENRIEIIKAKVNGGGHVRTDETLVEIDKQESDKLFDDMMEQNVAVKRKFKRLFDSLLKEEPDNSDTTEG